MEQDRFKKYRQSDKGKASLKRRSNKYLESEKGKATRQKWVDNNRDKINTAQRNRKITNTSSIMFSTAKYRAKKKGIEFSITKDDIIIPDFCPVLGIPISFSLSKDNSPSLDRINSKLGYIKGNIQVISFRANMLKNNASLEEIELLLKHLKSIQCVQ